MNINHLFPLRSQAPTPPTGFTPIGLPAAPEPPPRPDYPWLDDFLSLEPKNFAEFAEKLLSEWGGLSCEQQSTIETCPERYKKRIMTGFKIASASLDFFDWCTAMDEYIDARIIWKEERDRLTTLQWPWVWAEQSYTAGLAVLGASSVWHSPDEKPEKGRYILFENDSLIHYGICSADDLDSYEPTRWAYVKDIEAL